MKNKPTNLISHKNTVRKSRRDSVLNLFRGFTLMLAMTLLVMGCDSIVDQQTEADSGIATSDVAGALSESETPIICIDPDAVEYHVVSESETVEWGNRRNPFKKTVEIEYYNTLTEFVLRVKSSHAIADVLADDESIKDFDGTLEADTWQEFTFDLEQDWEADDEWPFSLKVSGFGPVAEFDVVYTLVGDCVFNTLSLAVYPEGAGTVTGGDNYEKGDVAVLEATANTGWAFVNWTDGDDNEISTLAKFDYTMPATDVTLTANFEVCGPITFTYRGFQVTYDSVVGANNRCWLNRNLGASQVAESSTDPEAYGDYFTFNDALTACPTGYRLPTEAEWQDEVNSWGEDKNATGAINSPLTLPMAGGADITSGYPYGVGSLGSYWSGTVDDTGARFLNFNSSNTEMLSGYLAYGGFSVRCLKEDTSD